MKRKKRGRKFHQLKGYVVVQDVTVYTDGDIGFVFICGDDYRVELWTGDGTGCDAAEGKL